MEESRSVTLVEAALEVLNEADPVVKAHLGDAAATRWLNGEITKPYPETNCNSLLPVPDRPARLPIVKVVPSHLMRKLGKGGSLESRQAILHSLVHTESWAIDLSWDIIARFGMHHSMPRDFFTDFVRVARDEARHFTLLSARLQEMGSYYGAFPAHDGLWDSAMATSHSLLARLAIEHCVHEVVTPTSLPPNLHLFLSNLCQRLGDIYSLTELKLNLGYLLHVTAICLHELGYLLKALQDAYPSF